jgi:hypothetical protein
MKEHCRASNLLYLLLTITNTVHNACLFTPLFLLFIPLFRRREGILFYPYVSECPQQNFVIAEALYSCTLFALAWHTGWFISERIWSMSSSCLSVSLSVEPQKSDVLSMKNINPGKKIPTQKKPSSSIDRRRRIYFFRVGIFFPGLIFLIDRTSDFCGRSYNFHRSFKFWHILCFGMPCDGIYFWTNPRMPYGGIHFWKIQYQIP